MAELVFPAVALALTFLILMPGLTLVSRAALARRRARASSWADFGGDGSFAWLVAPSLLPVAWLASSALHQSEPQQAAVRCLVEHTPAALTCLDAALLLGVLVVGVGVAAARHLRGTPAVRSLPATHPLARRLASLAAASPGLRGLRVVVAHQAPAPVCSVGLWRPRAVVDACFAEGADDAMLRAALLHEAAHIRSRDPLRSALAALAFALNPASAWLAEDLERWRHAREALCDALAVQRGGDPLALAEGITRAARFSCAGEAACGVSRLCGRPAGALRLRLALLLHGPPSPRRTLGHLALAAALVAALAAPHHEGVAALDHLHTAVERALHLAP